MPNQTMLLNAGTRGSALAVAQTHLVLDMLRNANDGLDFEVRTIKTSGDIGLEIVGAFVKEVEVALHRRDIDLAIHSLKDMPTALPEGVMIAATPRRGEHRDCLIARDNMTVDTLPAGARVGTSSLRRAYQLREMRPDLQVVPIKGNIITRMGKIDTGEVDAVILAAAGLERVGMADRISQIFSVEEMLPAVAQGILAIEVREADDDIREMVQRINDPAAEQAALAERSFLTAMGGGCRMPIGAYATVEEGLLSLYGLIYSENGQDVQKGNISGPATSAVELGRQLALQLLNGFTKKV